jgi:hypothetical protein
MSSNSGRQGYPGYPSRERSSYSYGARRNELGFHGDMRPNPRIEDELFFKNEAQVAGINFDNVRQWFLVLFVYYFDDSMTIFQLKSAQAALNLIMTSFPN